MQIHYLKNASKLAKKPFLHYTTLASLHLNHIFFTAFLFVRNPKVSLRKTRYYFDLMRSNVNASQLEDLRTKNGAIAKTSVLPLEYEKKVSGCYQFIIDVSL